MFKSMWNGFKTLGKKAIGYVRGLNGDKAATYLISQLSSWNPTIGAASAPFVKIIGSKINDKLDDWIKYNQQKSMGGIVKPPSKSLKMPITNMS